MLVWRVLEELIHQTAACNRHAMALGVHALDEAVVEALLQAAA